MNLAVDIGNHYTKLAVFNDDELVHSAAYKKFKLADLIALHGQFLFKNAILSDVSGDIEKTEKWLQEHTRYVKFTHQTPVPFTNSYKTPNTLGLDRIAAAAGAFAEFPNEHVLVIDAGTCITYEFIDDQGVYHGGGISPGMRIRFKALHRYTGKLPKLKKHEIDYLIGQNTEESILSGVINGVVAEINGIVQRYESQFSQPVVGKPLKVVLTGGDAKFFESYIKSDIFAIPNLVLKGLNKILTCNL